MNEKLFKKPMLFQAKCQNANNEGLSSVHKHVHPKCYLVTKSRKLNIYLSDLKKNRIKDAQRKSVQEEITNAKTVKRGSI